MNDFISYFQDFCNVNVQWPKADELKITISNSEETCQKACHKKGMT